MRKDLLRVFSIIAMLAFAAGAGGAFAQSPDKIVKQAVKALGGDKVLRAIRSTTIKGTITSLSDGSSGEFISQTSTPVSYYYSFELSGFQTSAGYNGKTAWTRDSRDGAKTLTGDAARFFQAEAASHSYRWFNYKADKVKISFAGTKEMDGKACSAISFINSKGIKVTVCFDKTTGLPVREEYPLGEGVKTFDYADFRQVDGVMEPFSIKLGLGNAWYRIKVEETAHNIKLDQEKFNFPRLTDEPMPKIAGLLEEVKNNQDKIEAMLEDYTYTETSVGRELDKNGSAKETSAETNQITFYKGNRISRQIKSNGSPLPEKQQQKEDERVADAIADIDKKLARQEKKGEASESGRVSIAEILRASNLINPRRETFRGRDVIVFDFEPNPAFDLKNAKSILKLFGHAAGVIWIDEHDKQVARMEAYLADSVGFAAGLIKLRKGASFSMEQDRINNEIWLPSAADINLSARVFLVKGVSVNQTTRYANYKKFRTEVKDAKVDPVKEQ